VPYVICPHCAVTSYVVRTSRDRGDPCPSCDEPLPDRAGAALDSPQRSSPAGHGPLRRVDPSVEALQIELLQDVPEAERDAVVRGLTGP
jgi:hypothetical protein